MMDESFDKILIQRSMIQIRTIIEVQHSYLKSVAATIFQAVCCCIIRSKICALFLKQPCIVNNYWPLKHKTYTKSTSVIF